MKIEVFPNLRLRPEGVGEEGFRNYHHLRQHGGQYAPAIGTSTQDVTDRERDAEALADFNDELASLNGHSEDVPF